MGGTDHKISGKKEQRNCWLSAQTKSSKQKTPKSATDAAPPEIETDDYPFLIDRQSGSGESDRFLTNFSKSTASNHCNLSIHAGSPTGFFHSLSVEVCHLPPLNSRK